jgi:hypothetical protein
MVPKLAKMDEHRISQVWQHQERNSSLAHVLQTQIVLLVVANKIRTSAGRSYR